MTLQLRSEHNGNKPRWNGVFAILSPSHCAGVGRLARLADQK